MMVLPSPRPIGAAPSSLLNGLVAYWKLEAASGTRVDSTTNANNLTAVNTPGNGPGVNGNAISLVAASSQEAKATNSSGLKWPGGDFTISRWVYYNTLQAFPPEVVTVAAIDHTTTFPFFDLGARQGNDSVFSVTNAIASAQSIAIAHTVPATGSWHHLVGVYITSSRIAKIWRDTVAGSDGAALPSDPSTGNVDFSVGGGLGVGYFTDGLIDECGYWNRALTTAEIGLLYGGGSPPTWPFSGLP